MKKIKSKAFHEYTKNLHIDNQFGTQKVAMCNFTSYVSTTVGGDELDFVICFDKCQEDWGFTNDLGVYGMQEVVKLLSGDTGDGEPEWKAETIEQIESWLKMLKEGVK